MKLRNKGSLIEKIINILLDFFIFVFGFVLLISIYNGIQTKIFGKNYSDFFGYTMFEVQTGSMADTINAGDWVIVEITKNVELNDIITFKEKDDFVTHRIVEEYKDSYVTKGDANNTKDAKISEDQVVGKVVKTLSNFGIFRKTLFSPAGLLTIIIILYIINLLTKKNNKDNKNNNNNEKEDDFNSKVINYIDELVLIVKDLFDKSKNKVLDTKNDIESKKEKKQREIKKQEEEKITLEKVKEMYGKVSEEDMEKTAMYRVVPVDLSDLDETFLEIAKNEMNDTTKEEKKEIIEDPEELEKAGKINLEMIKAKINSKKNKNPISKAMYIKKEELNEIIDILTREEKTLVNEATIKDIFIETYLQAKYYNMFDDKNIEYKGKSLSVKISKIAKDLAVLLVKSYKGSDSKYGDKVAKYVSIFILIANLEQAFTSITDSKARLEFYKKEITKYSKDKDWSLDRIKRSANDIIKSQRNFIGTYDYFIKKLDTNMFDLKLNKITNKNSKMFGVELEHNLNFSKVYSDYIIDKTYSEGIIAEDKMVVLLNLLSIKLLEDMTSNNFDKKYILYIPNTLYTKEKKLEKILGMIDDEYAKENVILLVTFDDLDSKKTLIKSMKKVGYKFGLVFEEEVELKKTQQNTVLLADYIFVNKKKIKVTKMLSFLPEDVFGEIVYDDIAEKVGDFGSDD